MFESFGLVTFGLLGGGFMLYVLFQWTRESVRNRAKQVGKNPYPQFPR